MLRILVATAVAITVASAGAASAKVRHHRGHVTHSTGQQMGQPEMGQQMGQPGAYGSPGNLTPGYSSTARHRPTDTNGGQ
jgi:hypothetical protein